MAVNQILVTKTIHQNGCPECTISSKNRYFLCYAEHQHPMALDQPMDDAKVNANGGIKHASAVRMG
jgi:hypothetical protein